MSPRTGKTASTVILEALKGADAVMNGFMPTTGVR
jgi:hypothetical protein